MTQPITLLQCQSLQELDRLIAVLPQPVIGPWGGRKFRIGNDSVALNQLVSKLLDLSKRQPNESTIIRVLIGKIRAMDQKALPQISLLRRILTAIRRLFGNYFFNRTQLLANLENQLPADVPPPKKSSPPIQRPFPKKSPPPPQVLKPAKVPASADSKLLKGWLRNPLPSGTSTLRLFKDIAQVRASPYTMNTSVEGLLMQCTGDKKVDLQEENSLLLLQGIFKFCVVTQLRSDYGGRQEDLLDWMSHQPTLCPETVDAAIEGYLSRPSLEIGVLLRILSLSKLMVEQPQSLGAALAKAVELHANNNELERLIENIIREKRLLQKDYALMIAQFAIKRGQEGKAGMRWKILDHLQEYAQSQGWSTDGHAAPVE